MKAKIRIENPFRVTSANKLYQEKGKNNSDCYEYGIDNNGFVYFALLNGVVKRYTRVEFIKMSRE